MATHHDTTSATVEQLACEVFSHMEHSYPRSWGVQDIQFLLDVIKEKDAELASRALIIQGQDATIAYLKVTRP